jgi:hypothetical protein
MKFDEWLQIGLTEGWCGPSVCETHDGTPTSIDEDFAFDRGEDPCIHIIRLYEDSETKAAVEENHSPSIWRATNAGYDFFTKEDK